MKKKKFTTNLNDITIQKLKISSILQSKSAGTIIDELVDKYIFINNKYIMDSQYNIHGALPQTPSSPEGGRPVMTDRK